MTIRSIRQGGVIGIGRLSGVENPGAPVGGRRPGCQAPEYAGGAPRADGADQGMGHA